MGENRKTRCRGIKMWAESIALCSFTSARRRAQSIKHKYVTAFSFWCFIFYISMQWASDRVLFENVLWACLHLFFSIARFSSGMSVPRFSYLFFMTAAIRRNRSECESAIARAVSPLMAVLETSRRAVCAFNGYWGVKIIIYKNWAPLVKRSASGDVKYFNVTFGERKKLAEPFLCAYEIYAMCKQTSENHS